MAKFKLPAAYEWLADEPGPVMLLEALKLLGVRETPGAGNNPVIMGWAKETFNSYPGDATAWCGLTMSIAAKRAGWDWHPEGNALWARNWARWGKAAPNGIPMLGDVLVFPRGQGGHVGIYVAEDVSCYHLLAGNQGDAVSIARKAKASLLAVRRAKWKTAQPANVRRVFVNTKGIPAPVKES